MSKSQAELAAIRLADDEWLEFDRTDVTVFKGDYVGHPFRGNQWSDSGGASTGGAGGETHTSEKTRSYANGVTETEYRRLAESTDYINDLSNYFDEESPISNIELTALRSYINYGGADINNSLRGRNQQTTMTFHRPTGKVVVPMTTMIAGMDQAFREYSVELPADTILYRGVGGDSRDETFADMKVGDEFVDKGFISTSGDEKIAKRFAKRESGMHGSTVIKIRAPKGLRAIFPDPFYTGGETEILLARGTRFRVVERATVVEYSYNRMMVIEVVPPKAKGKP